MHFRALFSYVLELIWLKSEVVTAAALFHRPSLDASGRMNHIQSPVVKTIGLLLPNVILCYPDSPRLLACTHWQNMWINKTHVGSLTYNSVKEKVNTNALPSDNVSDFSFYCIYLFSCGVPLLDCSFSNLCLFREGWLERHTHFHPATVHSALTWEPNTIAIVFSIAGQ